MNGILILLITLNLPGDMRVRGFFTSPKPRGIEESYWAGDGISFYQRLRLNPGRWNLVFLTEKDPGEEWGDLLTGAAGFSSGSNFSAVAGAMRVQFAHGLLLGKWGSWGSSDPLSMSKPLSWRTRIEPAESPGAADAGPFTGIASQFSLNQFSFTSVLSRSHLDSGDSGLHRSSTEIESRRSILEKLAAFRAGYGPAGLSFASVSLQEDSAESTGSRFGADLLIENGSSVLTGEFVTDLHTISDYVLSASRDMSNLRQSVTVSRNTGNLAGTSEALGTAHGFGAGYGARWRPVQQLLIDGGVVFLRKQEEDRFKTALQFTENLAHRTQLSQRLACSFSDDEQILTGRVTAGWNPGTDISLTIKVPFSRYSSSTAPDETGLGIEARLRHRLSPWFEYSVSAAGCSTEGWNSRVYAYSLSFPGEFGSSALYNRTSLLQASAMLTIAQRTILRARCRWYCMYGEETLGSGWEETEGSSRTSAGLQIDWNFQ